MCTCSTQFTHTHTHTHKYREEKERKKTDTYCTHVMVTFLFASTRISPIISYNESMRIHVQREEAGSYRGQKKERYTVLTRWSLFYLPAPGYLLSFRPWI